MSRVQVQPRIIFATDACSEERSLAPAGGHTAATVHGGDGRSCPSTISYGRRPSRVSADHPVYPPTIPCIRRPSRAAADHPHSERFYGRQETMSSRAAEDPYPGHTAPRGISQTTASSTVHRGHHSCPHPQPRHGSPCVPLLHVAREICLQDPSAHERPGGAVAGCLGMTMRAVGLQSRDRHEPHDK